MKTQQKTKYIFKENDVVLSDNNKQYVLKIKDLDVEIKNFAMERIQKTIKGNQDKQMYLMAYYCRKALGKGGEVFSDDSIAKLGLANTF